MGETQTVLPSWMQSLFITSVTSKKKITALKFLPRPKFGKTKKKRKKAPYHYTDTFFTGFRNKNQTNKSDKLYRSSSNILRTFYRYKICLLRILSQYIYMYMNISRNNSQLVNWYFEPSQPQRITSQLKTIFNLSPIYSAHKSSNHKSAKNHKNQF